MKRSTTTQLAKGLKISKARATEAIIKAELISAINSTVKKEKITHEALSKKSGLSRSSVTGILSGSLQKVTIDRILRLMGAVGLEAEIKVKKAA